MIRLIREHLTWRELLQIVIGAPMLIIFIWLATGGLFLIQGV